MKKISKIVLSVFLLGIILAGFFYIKSENKKYEAEIYKIAHKPKLDLSPTEVYILNKRFQNVVCYVYGTNCG